MEPKTAHDGQQSSHHDSNVSSTGDMRIAIVSRRPIRLLSVLNLCLFVVIGLGFILNVQTIYPRASSDSGVPASEASSPAASTPEIDSEGSDSRPVSVESVMVHADGGASLPVRVLDFVQFTVLVLIGSICGLISLGCLALISDRPFGDLMSGIIGISSCLWLSALALYVPAPEEFLIDPIQYSVAGLVLWLSSTWILGLGSRMGLSFTGGTVAVLGIMALGSRIVVWATWS